MRVCWLVLATALVCGGTVESDLAWREKKAERELQDAVGDVTSYVDASVLLYTVVRDPRGEVLIDGAPPMRIVNAQQFGGLINTLADTPHLCGYSDDPRIWFCSPQQEQIVVHRDEEKLAQLVHGSEGAGKTTAIAQWLYFRWLELLGEQRWIGMFAPTLKRLAWVQDEISKLWRPSWGRYVTRRTFEGYELCDGTKILFQHTHQQSAAQGSPTQGASLSAAARDELQDQVEQHAGVQSRGRKAKHGRYKQIATATAKDDSEWRALQDTLLSSGKWVKRSLSIYHSPFVDPAFLENVKGTISEREFLRRYGRPDGTVEELPSELRVYYAFQRARNLVANPHIATDVTAAVLSDRESYVRPGSRFTLLVTHDPGVIYNTSEIARLLVFPRLLTHRETRVQRVVPVPTWTVVGELQTSQTTSHQHAAQLRDLLRRNFHVELPHGGAAKAAVFVDPHGKGETDTAYDTVYSAFQAEQLDVFNPSPMTGLIRRSQRVEMMNRLLGDVADDWVEEVDGQDLAVPRLVVCVGEDGHAVAPVLVKALEMLKKQPGDRNAEGTHVKNARDQTHAPASLAYGLWPYEQEAVTRTTVERATAEARRIGVL